MDVEKPERLHGYSRRSRPGGTCGSNSFEHIDRRHRHCLAGSSLPLDTARMQLDRRISATFKDLPGGQVLGPTYDYTQRLLDFSLLAVADRHTDAATDVPQPMPAAAPVATPRVVDLLDGERDAGMGLQAQKQRVQGTTRYR